MDLSQHEQTDLGPNVHHLHGVAQQFSNATYVDLGVREGWSSSILCSNSVELNNTVIGVNVDFGPLKFNLVQGKNYKTILGDSVTVGKNWARSGNGPVDILFVDTVHASPQVLCELYYWTPHVKQEGYIIFHDTNWPEWLAENIGGVQWQPPVEALKSFFGLSPEEVGEYEDEFIKVNTHLESWGMTFVKIKQQRDFRPNVADWEGTFAARNQIMSHLLPHPSPLVQFDPRLAPAS